jgi:glycosyltransferase involved in cell wall biosynthesis
LNYRTFLTGLRGVEPRTEPHRVAPQPVRPASGRPREDAFSGAAAARRTGGEGAGGAGSGLRVLGWPAFSNRGEQPYNWLLYTQLRRLGVRVDEFSAAAALRAGRGTIIHLHWSPTSRLHARSPLAAAARSVALVALLRAARLRGTRVLWTAHNLAAHDRPPRPWLEGWFWPAFARCLDGVLSLSGCALETLHARTPAFRTVPAWVVPHGHYRAAYPPPPPRGEARARLGVAGGARVVAFVGQIRPYKGVEELVRAFARVDDPAAVLLLAGQMKMGDATSALRAAAAADPRVRLVEGLVPAAEMGLYLAAADLVALPYREILHSGTAILALSFGRPVLVPRVGALAELAGEEGPQWVWPYDGALSAETLAAALRWAATRPAPAAQPLRRHAWTNVAGLTLRALREIDRPGAALAANPAAEAPGAAVRRNPRERCHSAERRNGGGTGARRSGSVLPGPCEPSVVSARPRNLRVES